MPAKLAPDRLRAAAKAAFANAGSFAGDAKALIERGSYGHGLALTILAEEELGKGYLWQMMAAGFRIREGAITRHPHKLATMYVLSFLDVVLGTEFRDFLRIAASDGPLPDRVREMEEWLVARREDAKEREARFWSEMDSQTTRYASLNVRKLRGFYVDIRGAGTVVTPESVTRAEAVALLRDLHDRRLRLETSMQGLAFLTERNPAGRKLFVDLLRKAFEEDFGEWMELSKGARNPTSGRVNGRRRAI